MKTLIPLCIATVLVVACGQREEAPPPAPDTAPAAPETAAAPAAAVQLAPTQGNSAGGSLTLTQDGDAVRLTGSLMGLEPNGEFGFHIHEIGDCSAPDASSAGAHFNPAGAAHGNPQGGEHHAGDMLNVSSDAQGNAQVDVRAEGVSLDASQPNGVLNRAVVLHEKADDYQTQPSGGSGARIACGVISAG